MENKTNKPELMSDFGTFCGRIKTNHYFRNDLTSKIIESPVLIHVFFNKQQGSSLSPRSCLYFQGFQGSMLLNGCLVV